MTLRHTTLSPLSPKKILISHVYSSANKGDAALTSVLIQDLKRKFPDASLTILKLDPVKRGQLFEGVPEQASFMNYVANRYRNPLVKLGYTLYMVPATLAWAPWRRATGRHAYLPPHLHRIARLYDQADLIVPVGGGYIRSRKGLVNRLNVPLLLHPLLFGYLLGKPTVLYSMSVGPFQNRLEERMVAFVLKRMLLILVREDISMALLARLGVSGNVVRAIDSGFLLESKGKLNVRKQCRIQPGKLLVGVTVCSWLAEQAQAKYEQSVAAALDYLVENCNAHVIFVPQVTATKGVDDRISSRRVQSMMRHTEATTLIEAEPDHHDIKAIYDDLDILVGTRFHSVIFSLTSYVPVLAIEYEHKTSGIMHDLELDHWVVKIEDVTEPDLTTLLLELVQKQEQYRAHLHNYLPPYIRQAEKTIELLAESYAAALA